MISKFENAVFKTKLNQVEHEFEIYLDSGAGENESSKYPINPNSIISLNINDTLADWVVRGELVFLYNPESGSGTIDRTTGNDIRAHTRGFTVRDLANNQLPQDTGIDKPIPAMPFYTFRNDGFDLLRIRIKPLLKPDSAQTGSTTITDPVHWSLSYLFSIYDMEDIDLPPGAQNMTSSYHKCLKVRFWDSWYQKMATNVMEYSTGLSQRANIEQDKAEGIYSNPGVLPTGQIMKEIINLSLGQNSDQERGDAQGQTFIDPILKFNYEPIKEDEWEDGAAKMFFTAPAQATAFDDLMYVYDKHISNNAFSVSPEQSPPRGGAPDTKLHDFSILVKDKGPQETDIGQLTLKSVGSYFDKAGSGATSPGIYQYEHFFLQSFTDSNNKPKPTKRLLGPTSQQASDTVDFKSLKYGTITNYRLVDISAATNARSFVSSPVYSFDFKNRTFNAEFKNNSVLTARKVIAEKYIKPLYKKADNDLEKLFLINLNKDKQDKTVMPHFSLYGDDPTIRQHTGLQKLLYIGLFQNTAINFRTLGLTFREPGRFIAIDRTEGCEEGDFEDKFYGQWFVIDVKHTFETEFYYNDITAVKIHRFQELDRDLPQTV